MQRIEELNTIVSRHDLNAHPFYREWVAGTLPISKLKAYSAEYAHFVGTIVEGWDTVDQPALAEEERHHELLWDDFRSELGASKELQNPETASLVETAKTAFTSNAEAIGGLYAFEAQQPVTSRSKLDGLNRFYQVSEPGMEYFKVHADDWSEVRILTRMIRDLSPEEFENTKAACERVCKGMWTALDGVYKK